MKLKPIGWWPSIILFLIIGYFTYNNVMKFLSIREEIQSNNEIYEAIKSIFANRYGNIDTLSAVYDFTYTQYYAKEMGTDLR